MQFRTLLSLVCCAQFAIDRVRFPSRIVCRI